MVETSKPIPAHPYGGRLAKEQTWAVPGTDRFNEQQRVDAQQSTGADFVDGLADTAAAGAARTVMDEANPLFLDMGGTSAPTLLNDAKHVAAAALSIAGYRSGKADYDKEAKYDELTKDIPFEYHDDILDNDNFAAAQRARNRALSDMARGQRMMQQDSGTLAYMAGSMFDVDMPLAAFSGGAFGAAKVARTALRASRAAGLSPRAALRLSGAALGANAGLQAGVLVGAVDAYNRETAGWEDIANMAFQSMLLGSTVGAAVKGDVRVSVKAAHEEFLSSIAKDAPHMRESVNVNTMPYDNLSDYKLHTPAGEFEVKDGSTVGAAQVSGHRPAPSAHEDWTPTNTEWINTAENWRYDSGWGDRKLEDVDTWWASVASSGALNITTGNFNALWKSKAATANFAAGEIFESANGLGRGRATSAIMTENYHNRIQTHLGRRVIGPMLEWAKRENKTTLNSGYGISMQGMREFNREVMLELNDRRLGRSATRSQEVSRVADQYESAGRESLGILRGRDGETSVDGFDNMPDSKGYTPYRWDGAKIQSIIKDGVISKADIIDALADGYRRAGIAQGKDANAVAKAVMQRAISREIDMDMSVYSLMSGDGKDFMFEAMVQSGVSRENAERIVDRLKGQQHDMSKEGFAKARNDIDMNTPIPNANGADIRIVDLLDNDLNGVWQRYTRQVAGSAALARKGITNRAQRREFIDAIRAEQRALGEEPIEAGMLEAMFSHFNAGPVHGYAMGDTNVGVGILSLVKRTTGLALLNKLGLTQLAETGPAIAQIGLANWLQRGPMAMFNAELKNANRALLDDIAFVTGEIGQEHWHFAPWLDLDDTTRGDRAHWLEVANKYASAGSFLQGYTSLFNLVRSFQQRTSALAAADKVFREIKAKIDAGEYMLDKATQGRFSNDLGLMPDDVSLLFELVDNGTIEFATRGGSTFVNKLNIAKWDNEIAQIFGASVGRNINQLVQKSLAGEQDTWMHTHMGSLFMHLKTFPLQAIQKQVVRNMRFMDKQALATVLYGLATAAVASMVKDVLDGTERDALGTAKQAFNYSNMTGFIPMLYDPMMTLIGMDDARINQYGPNYDLTPPVVTQANRMLQLPGALGSDLSGGDLNWHDKQALRALPFANAYGLSGAFD